MYLSISYYGVDDTYPFGMKEIFFFCGIGEEEIEHCGKVNAASIYVLLIICVKWGINPFEQGIRIELVKKGLHGYIPYALTLFNTCTGIRYMYNII